MTLLNDSTSPFSIALSSFTSQWFLIPQGSGIIAVILHQLDYQFPGLTIISEIFWLYTLVLLLLFLTIYILRIITFPRETYKALSTDISETACLSSISITFTTIIQMIDLTLVHRWGPSWGMAAYVLWWMNTVLAVVCCIGIPYVFVKFEPPGIDATSPATNLPLIAALTAAAGGGVICRYGALDYHLQVPVIIVSYLLVGMALPLALGFDTVFLARLLDKSSPSGTSIYQDMILCGPWGQGSFALQALGAAVMRGPFAGYAEGVFLTASAAGPVGYASIFAGLLAWGQGTFWWAFAIVSIVHSAWDNKGRWRGLEFALAAWSLVFPWGVYTNAAVELGLLLGSRAFSVWSTVLAVMLVMIFLVNTFLTIRGIASGKLLGLKHGWNRRAYVDDERQKGNGNGNGNSTGGDTRGTERQEDDVDV